MLFATSMVVLFSLAAASPIQNSTVPTGNLTIVPSPLINGINLGYLTLNGDHSDYTDIGPDSVNPCTLMGGTTGTYQEFGCGTSDYGINKNGGYYAQCASFSEPDADGVHTEWHCS
ncbi:hypothetical protein B0H11DRAFT_1990452 [Mycena galericulata]|nr:hypothetical protein B0H11DRAFT_1990452 [Mycena galericulata]